MLFTHCQKRDSGVKKRSVLSKILIGFSENPLELGEIGGDLGLGFSQRFRCERVRKSLKTGHFRGSRICRYLPSNSAKFGFGNLTRNQVTGNRPWVRIPPYPPKIRTMLFCMVFFAFERIRTETVQYRAVRPNPALCQKSSVVLTELRGTFLMPENRLKYGFSAVSAYDEITLRSNSATGFYVFYTDCNFLHRCNR